ncbi:unnamed protein product [Closterium sp. NIES-54]
MAPLVGIARDDVDLIVPPILTGTSCLCAHLWSTHPYILLSFLSLTHPLAPSLPPPLFTPFNSLSHHSYSISLSLSLSLHPHPHTTQPSRQYCGVPARGLWHSLRRRHLLHPQGLPLFHRNWTQRRLSPLSDQQMALLPADWVVLLVRRPGKERVMEREGELEGSMRRVFGERLVVYGKSLPILQARSLFRRARLVVAVHGAGLSHTIFMPSNASVLEIRPRDYHNTCYHHLAEACDVNYYLMLGEGNKKGIVKADLGEVMGLVQTISYGWKDEPG